MAIALYDAAEVEELLDYPGCIKAMRQAMVALSSDERPQPLRQISTVGDNQMFGTMPGELRRFRRSAQSWSAYLAPGIGPGGRGIRELLSLMMEKPDP